MKTLKMIIEFTLIGGFIAFTSSCKKDKTESETKTGLKDIEGNVYDTVRIGTQVWMAENLKTTKYNNGNSIPLVTDTTVWSGLPGAGYCWYGNNALLYKNTYGALYNWFTVNTGKLCPTGWHVPSDEEWKTLEINLGMTREAADRWGDQFGIRGTDQGTQLKSKAGWDNGENGTNTSGFTALPGGCRNTDGTFSGIFDIGIWWSSTENNSNTKLVVHRNIKSRYVSRWSAEKRCGFFIRCVKNQDEP